MFKRSIEQEVRNKNFGIRNGNFEKNALVKNQGTKQRVQRILGDCWQWETNGQCVKGDNCSFRHDINKRGEVTPSNPSACQAMKIPAAKAAVDKEWEKLEKFSAWNLTKVRSKKEVIDEARTSRAKVQLASSMDMCYLKNAELEAKHQQYKGRVVLRGDIVNDDSGSYAVFIEQGSSASQMTAPKVMDVISRLPGCDGQAADAVSSYTQVKM